MSQQASNKKLLLLTEKPVKRQEMKCLYKFSADVAVLDEFKMVKKLDELFTMYDTVIVNLKDKKQFRYYSLNLNFINRQEVSVVFLRGNGNTLPVATVKEQVHADFCKKFLPIKCVDKLDYSRQLLCDHISAKSVSPSFLVRVAKKVLMCSSH